MDKVAADMKLITHHNQVLKLRLSLCHVPPWHSEGQLCFPVPLSTCLN